MACIHLLIGPVGAGKSTHAVHLQTVRSAVDLNLDAWMAHLYRDDERPEDRMAWYLERTECCLGLIWDLTTELIEADTYVVLEVGLIRRAERLAFYERVDDAGFRMTVYLVDAPRDIWRERVMARNRSQGEIWSMDVPLPIFEFASDLWEAPDDQEWAERDLYDLTT